MGLQLIFAVETNRKCKSDWIYIRDTIDRFYEYENTRIKLTPVYMDGKGKYQKKQSQIQSIYLNMHRLPERMTPGLFTVSTVMITIPDLRTRYFWTRQRNSAGKMNMILSGSAKI